MKELYTILRGADIASLRPLQEQWLEAHPGWKPVFKRYFLACREQAGALGREPGAVSYIVQPPLDGRGAAVFIYLVKDAEVTAEGCTTVVRDGATAHYWTAGLVSGAAGAEAQTRDILERYEAFLTSEGMTVEANCVRTWFFVDDIDRNYAGMVKARRENFLKQGLTPDTHYIASTGIFGTPVVPGAVVQLDACAVRGQFSQQYLYALSHMNRTIEYGVTFERGVRVDYAGCGHLLVSGTASIDDRGQVLHRGDVLAQAGRMFENIDAVLREGGAASGDVRMAVTYIRRAEDAAVVAPLLDRKFGTIPHVLTLAPVCRPDWLIETECIAVTR